MASSTGTEYVNAQVEELKETIDDYADKISQMTSGAVYGMVYMGLFPSPDGSGVVAVHIVGEKGTWSVVVDGARKYYGARYTLYLAAGCNSTGGYSRTVDTGIPEAVRPDDTVTARGTTSWYDYSPERHVVAELKPSGRLTLTVDDDADGQTSPSMYYYKNEQQ